MIKNLQNKIVWVNMMYATLISSVLLVCIFIALYISCQNYINSIIKLEISNYNGNNREETKIELKKPDRNLFLNFPFGFQGFFLFLDKDYTMDEQRGTITISEHEISTIMEKEKRLFMMIDDIPYYILKDSTENEILLVFYNRTDEIAYLKNLAFLLFTSEMLFLCIFYIVSRKISILVTNPISRNIEEQKSFISNAAHELKTPLTIIYSNVGLLMDENEGDSQTIYLHKIQNQVEQSRELIIRLLELAKIDEMKNEIEYRHMEPINISHITQNIIFSFDVIIYEENLEFLVEVMENVTLKITKQEYHKMITVLLENAVKYCDKKGIIQVNLNKKHFSISNSFSGKKLDEPMIFQRFYKESTDNHSFGLGLSMVKEVCEIYNLQCKLQQTKDMVIFSILF